MDIIRITRTPRSIVLVCHQRVSGSNPRSIYACNGFVQLAVMILSNSDLIFLFNYNRSTKISVQYRTVIGNQFSLTYLKPMAPYNWNVAAWIYN